MRGSQTLHNANQVRVRVMGLRKLEPGRHTTAFIQQHRIGKLLPPTLLGEVSVQLAATMSPAPRRGRRSRGHIGTCWRASPPRIDIDTPGSVENPPGVLGQSMLSGNADWWSRAPALEDPDNAAQGAAMISTLRVQRCWSTTP